MKTDDPRRRFSRQVKLAAVQRMAAGANISKLSRELGISRKGLYQWRKQFRSGGATSLQDTGRPRWGMTKSPEQKFNDTSQSASIEELAQALTRIAELERLVGQQAVDLDFFSAKACRVYSASYPAALKKFSHSVTEKRAMMSPRACAMSSKLRAARFRRSALSSEKAIQWGSGPANRVAETEAMPPSP
ncbi:transposase-like protein [Pseudorhizobium tarimense]|uniref:Transposase-like protein n=1 Tax=Pseudorhizobium tarimense TaxID=1079109 RepID=A0ABV2H6D1_9HYPH